MFAGVTSSSRATCPNTETRRGRTSVIRKKNVAGYGLEPLVGMTERVYEL